MSDKESYYLTPLLILGAQRYADLESLARRIMEKKHGKNAQGVPILVFDGKGGSFEMALTEEER